MRALGAMGFLQRMDQQFHWSNAGYRSYDDFLATLASRKRKAIRKEREAALANGIRIRRSPARRSRASTGTPSSRFYMDTGARKWGRPYLNRAFFAEIGRTMAGSILLVMASGEGRPIAGAINFIGHDALYGRNWGCIETTRSCISRSATIRPSSSRSKRASPASRRRAGRAQAGARLHACRDLFGARHIADPRLREAVADYLVRERRHVEAVGEALAAQGPFRKDLRADEEA